MFFNPDNFSSCFAEVSLSSHMQLLPFLFTIVHITQAIKTINDYHLSIVTSYARISTVFKTLHLSSEKKDFRNQWCMAGSAFWNPDCIPEKPKFTIMELFQSRLVKWYEYNQS